jgi:hypothetical protein
MNYIMKEIRTDKVMHWTAKQVLAEINRDRNEEWLDYDETDLIEGWIEWCEGDQYTMLNKPY